jgi:hypothetical protein
MSSLEMPDEALMRGKAARIAEDSRAVRPGSLRKEAVTVMTLDDLASMQEKVSALPQYCYPDGEGRFCGFPLGIRGH